MVFRWVSVTSVTVLKNARTRGMRYGSRIGDQLCSLGYDRMCGQGSRQDSAAFLSRLKIARAVAQMVAVDHPVVVTEIAII